MFLPLKMKISFRPARALSLAAIAIAAAAVAATFVAFAATLALAPALANAHPQEQTIDLSAIESAPEYRTTAPDRPGFLGNAAAALEMSLASVNQSLSSSLRPDHRLGRLARWVHGNLGAENSLPPQSALDVLTRRLGLAEPLPHLLVIEARGTPRLADVVSARLAKVFDLPQYTHIGGVAEREGGRAVVVIALSRRRFRMAPVPRNLSKPGRVRLDGRLIGPYTRSELAHMRPGGQTAVSDLGSGLDFTATVRLTETGRHRLEIIAHGPAGPDIVANFPVFVGVPADESVESIPVPEVAPPPEEVRDRLFELINADRVESGLGLLTFDPELAAVALRHSEDMRDNDFVAHISPATGTTEERLLRAGIMTHLAAENVGRGYAPDEIHRGFLDSPGHRAAVFLAGATHAGIGVVAVSEHGRTSYLVTEVFIRRIPPLGPDAKRLFLEELNGRRTSAGSLAVGEDIRLSQMADETAREFLAEPSLTEGKVQGKLASRLKGARRGGGSYYSMISIVGSLEEGAQQAAADPKTSRAGRVGIGIAQGSGPGLAPNTIVLVLIFVR